MTTEDLLGNLGITKSKLRVARRGPISEDTTKDIGEVLPSFIVALIREHVELEGQEPEPDARQLELGGEA